jgi:hypothetical protein
MKKIYNPKDQMRPEMPETDKRLQLRKTSLLRQRFGISRIKNEDILWDTIENHIENYPEEVFNHIYKYKTNGIQRLTLCRVGLSKLHEKLEIVKPILIGNLRKEKFIAKAKMNVAKELRKTDPLSRVIK